jgi:hypothetical protein
MLTNAHGGGEDTSIAKRYVQLTNSEIVDCLERDVK